jgi:ABC-type sugar transport system ATPase subunit
MEYSLLEAIAVSKSYEGVPAIENVSFCLKPGSIHALCGENGAGKSTFVKILMGIIPMDAGELFVGGKKVHFLSPRHALEHGISIIEQELSPIPDMTIAENIFLGREGKGFNPFINYRQLNERAESILSMLGINLDPRLKMKKLKVAEMQLVEIAKAISYDSDIILMDEPTSAIGEKEVEKLFSVIAKLKNKGKGVIYISHRLKEILSIADEITILRDGIVVEHGPKSKYNKERLIGLMIGRKIDTEFIKENIPANEPALEVRNLSRKGEFSDISLDLYKGEILGIFGLLGSGRTEFLNALFGITTPDEGTIYLYGKRYDTSNPRTSIERKIAYVTEDRKDTGLILSLSVAENISIASLRRFSPFGFLNRREESSEITKIIKELGIKTAGHTQLVKYLSGGNQQKVVLGRWIMTNPSILLLDEPTRGIDVGAKHEIYKFISDYASQGNSVLMVSSELPEIIGMCDRVVVFKGGRINGILERNKADQETLMNLAS